MPDFKPVDFFSKISDYVIVFKDREVVYHGLKEVEMKPSTKVVFHKGKYTCTDKYVYDLLMNSSAYKTGKVVEVRDIIVPTATNGIVFKKTTLARMGKDDLIDVAGQMSLIVNGKDGNDPTKDNYIDAIMAKQETAPIKEPVVAQTSAMKGAVSTNSVSLDSGIVVPTPEVG